MPSISDLLQAKQTLGSHLLRLGLRGGVLGMAAALRVTHAVARASQTVHAIGIGRKLVYGSSTPQRCVRVYVVQKLAPSLLPPKDRIPASIDGVPTDVIESPPAYIYAKKKAKPKPRKAKTAATESAAIDRRQSQRPVIAGISTGHFEITMGTIGYFCRSRRTGDNPTDVYVLSNNHIYASLNHAREGDYLLQPGPGDGGQVTDTIAEFKRTVTLVIDGTTPNKVDAAIGRLRPDAPYHLEILRIGAVSGASRATEGMIVCKHGRTTGFTEGHVTDESYDTLVGMDDSDPSQVAFFQNQIRFEPQAPYPAIALGGDSGSLILQKDNRSAVGLYFSGPEGGSYGVANHIHEVLNELEIDLL